MVDVVEQTRSVSCKSAARKEERVEITIRYYIGNREVSCFCCVVRDVRALCGCLL